MNGKFTKKRLLSTIIIFLLVFGASFGTNLGKPKTASAAYRVGVSFMLVDEQKFWKTYPDINPDCFVWVGNGTANYTQDIWNDPVATKNAIVSGPSVKYDWRYLSCVDGAFYILAPNPNLPSSSSGTNKLASSPSTLNKAIEPAIHVMSRNQIIHADKNEYNANDSLKWDGYKQNKSDVADGVIPVSLLDDPVYTSMNLPSETICDYMVSARRDNGHIVGDTSSPNATNIVGIGAFYPTRNAKLPDTMKLCIGKIKVFGYNKYTKKWDVICSDPRAKDARVYTLPWSTSKQIIVPTQKYDDHLEVTVTSSQLQDNVLHFWGTLMPFDKTKYLYYATAYTFWAEGVFTDSCLTAVNGIDVKKSSSSSTEAQLVASRGMAVKREKRTIWSTTIPNSEYNPEWGTQLQNLYNQK